MRPPFRFAIIAGERIERGTQRKPVPYRSASEPSGAADPARRGRPSAARKRVSQTTRDSRARVARAAAACRAGSSPAGPVFPSALWPRSRRAKAMSRSCGCCGSHWCFAAIGSAVRLRRAKLEQLCALSSRRSRQCGRSVNVEFRRRRDAIRPRWPRQGAQLRARFSTFAIRSGTPNSLRQTSASTATPSRICSCEGLAKHSRSRLPE